MYTGDGFHSIWHNWMVKALDKELLSERFQERDIRKNTASEVELEHTQLLLGHDSVKTTIRNYRLLPIKVKLSKQFLEKPDLFGNQGLAGRYKKAPHFHAGLSE